MKFSMKRALALLLALLMAVPAFAFAEPLDNDFEIAFEEEVEETVAEDSVDEVAFDLSELSEAEPEAPPADEAEELEVDEEIVEEETEETAEDEAALVVLNPAFVQTVAVEGGSITVKAAEGVFPNDAVLSVTPVQMDVVGEVEGEIKSVYTYDIKVFSADGEELYQPDDDELVEIIFDLPEVADEYLTATVFHVLEDEEVEELAVTAEGANAKVVTRSFSFYQVIFYYNGSSTPKLPTGTYTLKSGDLKDGILLSQILNEIGELNTITAGRYVMNDSLELTLSDNAQTLLEKTEYTTTYAGTQASKDYILTPKKNYNLVPHDQYDTYFMTVEHTVDDRIFQVKIYLEFADDTNKVAIETGSGTTSYYEKLEDAITNFTAPATIWILDDLTTTAAVEMKDKAFILNPNQKTLTVGGTKVLNVIKANADTSLTIPATVAGGTLAADILVSGGASFTVASGAKATFDGTVTAEDNSTVTIASGTFNKAVSIATAGSQITGGTFNAAVTVVDHAISGGYFATEPTAAQMDTNCVAVPVNNYWRVVSAKPSERQITYKVQYVTEYNATTRVPTFANVTTAMTGVTIPTDQYYYDDSTDATVLWDAATAYAEFGEVDYWYRCGGTTSGKEWKEAVYDKREAGEAPTALTEIPAKSREDESTLKFVALVTPYLATVNGKGYTTLAEAGKAAVDGSKSMVLLRKPVTNSLDYYELARGKTLVVDVSKTGSSKTTEQWAEDIKGSGLVRAGLGDDLTYTYNDNSHEITFAVAPQVALVVDENGVQTFYSKFEKEGSDPQKEYALNQALAASDRALFVSAPIAGSEPTIARAITVGDGTTSWRTAIIGLDNITFETNGSLIVNKNTTLVIDSENYSKVKGTDATSFLVVVDPETEDENKFQWSTTSAKWVPWDASPEAILFASNGTEKGKYETLKKAVAAASANDVIVLQKDITLVVNNAKGEDGIVTVSKNLTIDTNGHTLTSNAVNTVVVDGGATVTIIGNEENDTALAAKESVTNTNDKTGSRAILVNNGTLVLKDAHIKKSDETGYAIEVGASGALKVEKGSGATATPNFTAVTGYVKFNSGATASITDGRFTDKTNIAAKLTTGYYLLAGTSTMTNYWLVESAEAYIEETETGYPTLAAAVAAAAKDQTIHLVKNTAPISSDIDVTKDLTLEMDGYNVVMANNIKFYIYNGATLTVNGTNAGATAPASVFTGRFVVGHASTPAGTMTKPGNLVIDNGTYVGTTGQAFVSAYTGKVNISNAIVTPAATTNAVTVMTANPNSVEVTLAGNNDFTVGTGYVVYSPNSGSNYGLKKLNVTGGTYKAAGDAEFYVASAFADQVNAYGDKSGTDVGGITGGKFAHDKFSKGGTLTNLDELCPYGYAVTSKADTTTKLYEVGAAWQVKFFTSYPEEVTGSDPKAYELKEHELPNAQIKVVKGEAVATKAAGVAKASNYYVEPATADLDPTYTGTGTKWTEDLKKKYAFDHYYNAADTTKAAFALDTVVPGNITLKAEYVEPVAWLTVSTVDDYYKTTGTTYFGTLEDAFNAWKLKSVDAKTQEKTYYTGAANNTVPTTRTLQYKNATNKKTYTITTNGNAAAANLANIDGSAIQALVDQVAAKTSSDANLIMKFSIATAGSGNRADTWEVTAYVATSDGTYASNPVTNAMLQAKPSITLGSIPLLETTQIAKPDDADVQDVTVVLCTDIDGASASIKQTLTDQTRSKDEKPYGNLVVAGVEVLGEEDMIYLKAYARAIAKVTTADGVVTYHQSFVDAVNTAKAAEGSTLTMLVDYDVYKDVVDKNDPNTVTPLMLTGDFTLDLNGQTLSVPKNNFVIGAKYDSSKSTQPTTNVTIKDSTGKDGKISRSTSWDRDYDLIYMIGNSTLTLESGTIDSMGCIAGVVVGKYSHLKVNGGAICGGGTAVVFATNIDAEAGYTGTITATVDINGGYVGCTKADKSATASTNIAIHDDSIEGTGVCKSTVNITGGFVMGIMAALDLNKEANLSISGGYVGVANPTGKIFYKGTQGDGHSSYLNCVSGGCFTDDLTLANCVNGVRIVDNTDTNTKTAFPKTVVANVVAMYDDGNSSSPKYTYVSAIDESVLAKSVNSTIGLKLLANTAVVAPLVVSETVTIDLNGFKLSAAKITAEQFEKLSAAEKAAKSLTSVADCKHGISVASNGTLTIVDSKYTDGSATPGNGEIAGAADLEATIYVAGTLKLDEGKVTNAGAGNAIYDAGTVKVADTTDAAVVVESKSGIAIEVKDASLTVGHGTTNLAAITGASAVKFGKSASTKAGKVTIVGGTLTGNTGAALIVDNTGKTLVSTTTTGTAIANVNGGTFKAPAGTAPIQTLDDSGAAATKATVAPKAYVGKFVSGTAQFSAPIDNTALVAEFPETKMCSTVADESTKLYKLVDAHAITLIANGGSFTEGTTLTVYVPDGQLLATGENYEAPTWSQKKFLGWTKDVGGAIVDTTSTTAKVTTAWINSNTDTGKLYAKFDTNTLTVTLKMNGGAFTPSGDYTTELYNNYGINRRVYDTANKTLKIEKVPEGTAVSTLVLTAAKGSYAAELAGTTTGMVFDSWKNAAGTVVTTITEDIELTAAWKPVTLALYDGVSTTTAWKSADYEYGKALNADEVKAALTKMVEENKAELLAKAPADTKLVETDMFTKTPEGAPMTENVSYTIKWTAKNYVAQVGNDKFETIEEAIAAAGTDKVITLLKEIESVELAKGQSIKVTPVDNLPKANVKVPEDQALKTDTKDTYTEYAAADIVAQIGNEKYASLEDAIANNASNAPIDLKKAASYKLPAGTSLKIKEGAELATITDSKNQPVTGVKGADGVTTFTDTNEKEKHTVTFVVETAQTQVEVEDGQPVAKPADPTSETYKDFVEWQTAEGEAYDFSKPVTANMTLTAVLTPSSFKRRVDFEGQLKLVFTFAPTEAATKAGAKVVWTDKDGKATTVALDELNEGKLEIPAMLPEWAEQVNVKLVVGSKPVALIDGDGFDCTNGFNYSIQQYTLDAQEKSTNPKMIALGKALYDYGTAAQIHFKVGDYSGLTVSDEVKAVTKDQIGESVTRSGELPEGITATGASVNFESDHSLRVSYTLASGKKPSDYTVKVTDKTGAEKTVEWEDKGNGVYHIKVKNIAGAELADEYTFAISAGGKTHTTVMSGVRYAATAVEKGSATMKDLGKACYLYYKAAAAYFGK